jgi:hypothetical protein
LLAPIDTLECFRHSCIVTRNGRPRAHPPLEVINMLPLILYVFAFVLFAVAGFVAPAEPWRGRLLCIGLACMAGAEVAGRMH